jgi:RHS repeat-associated protein
MESFGAYGQRRGSNWTGAPTPAELTTINDKTRKGFTEHEMLDNTDLVHMNGRVYDPVIGRFASSDPGYDRGLRTQGWNRYAYVGNRTLSRLDSTGFLTCVIMRGDEDFDIGSSFVCYPDSDDWELVWDGDNGFIEQLTVTNSSTPIVSNYFAMPSGFFDLPTLGSTPLGLDLSLTGTLTAPPPVTSPVPPYSIPDTNVYRCAAFGDCDPPPLVPNPVCANGSDPSRQNNPELGSNMRDGILAGADVGALAGIALYLSNVLGFPEVEIGELATFGAYSAMYGVPIGASLGGSFTLPLCRP